MRFQLEVHGDPLERESAEFIRQHLPAYAQLWEEFIGNDGRSQLPAQALLREAVGSLRLSVSQWTYSALEAVLCASRLRDYAYDHRVGDLRSAEGVRSYLDAINAFVAFFAQVGRVRDCFKELAGIFGDPSLWTHLDDFFKQRSNVLHEAKAPAAIIDGVFSVVEPEGTRSDPTRWGKGRTWADAAGLQPVWVAETMDRVLSELMPRVNDALARLAAEHLYHHLADARRAIANLDQAARTPVATTLTAFDAFGAMPGSAAQSPGDA